MTAAANGRLPRDNDVRPVVIRHVDWKVLVRVRQSSSPPPSLRVLFPVYVSRSALQVSSRAVRLSFLNRRDSCPHTVACTTRKFSSVHNSTAVCPIRNVQAQGVRRRRRHDQGTYIRHAHGSPARSVRRFSVVNSRPKPVIRQLLFPSFFHCPSDFALSSSFLSSVLRNPLLVHCNTHTRQIITRCCSVFYASRPQSSLIT